jgi:hypothetical protein
MPFTFAGNKFGVRNRSDNYEDNSTRINVNANQEVNVNTSDTYHIDLGGYFTEEKRESSEGEVSWTKEQWLDYCRRVLFHVKQTIIKHEEKGQKLENICYTDPECATLEISFLSEDGRLDKAVIEYNDLYE